MLLEQAWLLATTSTEAPPWGLTIVAFASNPRAALHSVREIWTHVAALGRWCDDELGDWPSQLDNASQWPTWLAGIASAVSIEEVMTWLDDIHDRSWI